MRIYVNCFVLSAMVVLLAAGSGWAGETTTIGDGGINSPYDSGVVQLYGESQTEANSDFGRIQLYQFNRPSGSIQSGTLYRFGETQGAGSPQVTPMILIPHMGGVPLIPVVPLLPILPNGGMAPVVPNIGVITPGPTPGTSTWGHGR